MKNLTKFISTALALGFAVAHAQDGTQNCQEISLSVTAEINNGVSSVPAIVAAQVSESPSCACEIVKTSISYSKADAETVAAIVESAIIAAPDQLRLISQCAIAAAPDAADEIQAVVARLGSNSGESAGDAKDSKTPVDDVASETSNPLDFPGDVDGGNTVSGWDLNSAGGIGDGSGLGLAAGFFNPNIDLSDGTPVVTNPNP